MCRTGGSRWTKVCGLSGPPDIAVEDGALCFWKALDEVFPDIRHQRCRTHKLLNVLNKLPESLQPAMKTDLREISQDATRAAAETAKTFLEKYGVKVEKAVTGLTADREALPTFNDFPPPQWDHPRMLSPIESVLAILGHRRVRTKNALSQKTETLMVFKLVQPAAKTWCRLKGANQLPLVVEQHATENRAA